MTRTERLMEVEAVRKHHRALYDAYARETFVGGPGTRAYLNHLSEHRADAARRRQPRTK